MSLRGIKLDTQIHKVPSNCEAKIYFEDECSEEEYTNNDVNQYIKKLHFHFPILVIYEEFNMTDYMQDVSGFRTFEEIKNMLFEQNLPWDKEKLYTKLSVKFFYEINKKDSNLDSFTTYYYPIKESDTLINLLTNSKIIMNGFPVISVVSTNSKFYNHFIKNKIILKRNKN